MQVLAKIHKTSRVDNKNRVCLQKPKTKMTATSGEMIVWLVCYGFCLFEEMKLDD